MDTHRLHDTKSYIHGMAGAYTLTLLSHKCLSFFVSTQPENVFSFIDLSTAISNFISIIQTLKRDTAYDTQLYILIDNDWRERGHSTTNIRRKCKNKLFSKILFSSPVTQFITSLGWSLGSVLCCVSHRFALINSLWQPCDAYMCQQANHHWFR